MVLIECSANRFLIRDFPSCSITARAVKTAQGAFHVGDRLPDQLLQEGMGAATCDSVLVARRPNEPGGVEP